MRPEVMELIENRTITCKEAILLMAVDSLVELGGKDCYASNAYLGKVIGVKEWTTGMMISNLKNLGLLEQTGFNGRRRLLVTVWSRLPKLRPVTDHVGSENSHGSHVRTHEAIKRPLDITTSTPKTTSKTAERNHPRWIRFSTLLKDAISTVRKVNQNSKVSSWAQDFFRLKDTDGITIPRINTVLTWYCIQVQKGDLIRSNSSFLPVAYSGGEFREKFLRIEDAMTRAKIAAQKNGLERGPRIVVTVEEED